MGVGTGAVMSTKPTSIDKPATDAQRDAYAQRVKDYYKLCAEARREQQQAHKKDRGSKPFVFVKPPWPG